MFSEKQAIYQETKLWQAFWKKKAISRFHLIGIAVCRVLLHTLAKTE